MRCIKSWSGVYAPPDTQLLEDDLQNRHRRMTRIRKRGRPRKQEHEKRSVSLPPIRCTPDELAYIEEQAAIAGMAVSTYAREALTKRVVKPRQTKAEAALLAELNRGGVNLHQLVRHMNFGNGIPSDISAVLDDYAAVLAAVGRAYDT